MTTKGFDGRSAIITGGASGIGRAMAEALAERGAAVVLADLQEDLAREVAASIRGRGGRADGVQLDVTDAAAVQALVEQTAAQHGKLDYLFNNAGIAVGGLADQHELADWYRVLDVNLRGVVHGVHAAYPLMIQQGSGHIVNTASLAGLIPAVGEIAYVASKYAVVGLSGSLRVEGADHGVKVSVVCPGFVDTPILFENLEMKDADLLGVRSRSDLMALFRLEAMPVDQAAQEILAGVAANRAVITVASHAKTIAWLQRFAPVVVERMGRKLARKLRRKAGR
ncbi:MAG: SDR family NAD(P)-dependent oxidoreductase [Deltaproteobacteria bacterium]|jgi:NAD(P)-dependent dehydrogenase (short-subunit alcohol dehydrogenase family)|nr:SDR family NAD(P)-dependent oxidoreductase [Deltaproteobacteria bacterium]MBW2536868.1 SDR family NAD(P)-dependent oxidoreductase [Deltaproteobacteria bacterium]